MTTAQILGALVVLLSAGVARAAQIHAARGAGRWANRTAMLLGHTAIVLLIIGRLSASATWHVVALAVGVAALWSLLYTPPVSRTLRRALQSREPPGDLPPIERRGGSRRPSAGVHRSPSSRCARPSLARRA